MPEHRSFWNTVPGLITGIAAIISGLVALVSVFGRGGNHSTSNSGGATPPATAVSSPTPGASASGTTSSATDGSSPGSDTGGSSPGSDTGGITATAASPGSPALLTANPAPMSFGDIAVGQTSPVENLTVTNAGGSPATLGGPTFDGADASWFTVASSTCGDGASLQPGASCLLGIQVKVQAFSAGSASLDIPYQAGTSQTLPVGLSVTGTIL